MGGDLISEVSDRTIDLAAKQNEKEKNGAEKEVGGKGEESMEQEIGKRGEEVGEGVDEMKIEAYGKVKLNKKKPSVRAGAKHGPDEVEFSEENGDKTKDTKMWFDRPIRHRKSVERLVLHVENKADREIQIEKGSGNKLKDIPNVAFQLSRKRNENALKLLYSVLFGRRGKIAEMKQHVLRFSGFVWRDEEKEKYKVREKLDRCVKDKLLGMCHILDIPVSKKDRKEDIIVKLMEFFEAPHAPTSELVSEKEQSSEGKKRKRPSKSNMSAPGATLSELSSKKVKRIAIAPRKGVVQKIAAESQNEFGEVEEKEKAEDNEENGNGLPEKSSDEKFEQADCKEKEKKSEGESEEENGEKERKPESKSGEEEGKHKSASKNTPSKKDTVETSSKPSSRRDAAGSIRKASLEKNTEGDKQQPPTWKMYSRKETAGKEVDKGKIKLAEETPNPSEAAMPQPTTAKKPSNKETAGMNVGEAKGADEDEGKSKPAEETPYPSDRVIQEAIWQIIQEADINQVTYGDIIRTIGKQFNMDPAPRKLSIKLMIQDFLSKLSYDTDDNE